MQLQHLIIGRSWFLFNKYTLLLLLNCRLQILVFPIILQILFVKTDGLTESLIFRMKVDSFLVPFYYTFGEV